MGRIVIALLAVLLLSCVVLVRGGPEQGCVNHPWPYDNNTLLPGQVLRRGESLAAKTAELVFDEFTGDVVLRSRPDLLVLWSAGTVNVSADSLILGNDGNLAIYNSSGSVLWTSGTHNATILVVEDSCRLSLYAKAPFEDLVWSSGHMMCITAHITMHSHDDVGWLLTPEQYSDGCNSPGGGTDNIFTNMMTALADNPTRKFSEVEMYFFERWWNMQDEYMRNLTKQLVANKQLEFVNAGWSMHDEACVHQESAISNMEAGAQFLRNTFGDTMNITIGWHIDPFGHASTTPRIMAQMGFNAFFFWRTDYQHREYMMKLKTVESMWNPSPSLGPSVQMFTSIMFDSYCQGCSNDAIKQWGSMCPSPFHSFSCEEATPWQTGSGPIFKTFANMARKARLEAVAKESSPFFGASPSEKKTIVEKYAYGYVELIRGYAEYFRTGHVLIPWGCDFQHQNAHVSFELMDLVLGEVNSNSTKYGVKMVYSHPSEYIQAVKDMDYQWPRNDFDYFLDSDNGHSYWSGYLSSRAEYKGYERHLMNERVGVELAVSAVNMSGTELKTQLDRIKPLREALGIAQHHDSITGTERINVREQYQFLLSRGAASADEAFSHVIESHTGVPVYHCTLANLSFCPPTNGLPFGNVTAFVFNPLSRVRMEYITIPVPVPEVTVYAVYNGSSTMVSIDVTPTWALTTTRDMPSPEVDSMPYQITFPVSMQPLDLLEFILVNERTESTHMITPQTPLASSEGTFEILSDHYRATFDATSGMITHLENRKTQAGSPMSQNIMTYCPHNNTFGQQASGAYIFRTCGKNEKPVPYTTVATGVVVLQGQHCSEVRQFLSNTSNIHQTWKLCNGVDYAEVTSGIGEIEMGLNGTEVIMKMTTDIDSNGRWYTDSEALEMQERITNHRPNYPYNLTEPVASNYFPCNGFTFINSTKDAGRNLAVVADRSRATASLHEGELEFLVQRRLMFDDARGVNQNLNETTRVLTTSRVILNSDQLTTSMRFNSLLMTHKPLVRFGTVPKYGPPYAGFTPKMELPSSIHLHTRSILAEGKLMVRLQHLFAVDEPGASKFGKSEMVDIRSVLPSGMAIVEFDEYDINGITPLAEMHRHEFLVCSPETLRSTPVPQIPSSIPSKSDFKVILHPMDIRTYIIQYRWS